MPTTPRFSFTRSHHLLGSLGNPDDNYLCSVAKVQGSSMMICTDSHLHRLYLMDVLRPYKGVGYEVQGYHMNDLAISSVALLDGDDGSAVCGDICVDDAGYNIYVLMVSTDKRGAWIKVFRHLNRHLSYTGLRYRVPENRSPLSVIMNETFRLRKLGPTTHIGLPELYSQLCYGTGIEIMNGNLYVLTRRKVLGEFITRVRYDAVINPRTVQLTEEDAKKQPGEERSGGGGNLYRLRLYEKRTAELQFSLLSVLNANTGDNLANYYLSYPGTTEDSEDDAVFHGLSTANGRLYSSIRYDKAKVPSDLGQWHLVESRYQSNAPDFDWVVRWGVDKDGNPKLEEGYSKTQILGFVKHEYALGDEGKSFLVMPYAWLNRDRVACTKAVRELQSRVRQISAAALEQETPVFQTRGQSALVSFDEPIVQLHKNKDRLPLLGYRLENQHYPFGVSMPYSMTMDRSERKLYGVYGNQIWVFDMLDYTILVKHPDNKKLFEGDIIDFGNILESNRAELNCFIRNDSYRTMKNTVLSLELDGIDSRREDVFLLQDKGQTGHKTLDLGDIGPGQSRSFWINILPLDVKAWESGTTHTMPLRVQYQEDVDSEY